MDHDMKKNVFIALCVWIISIFLQKPFIMRAYHTELDIRSYCKGLRSLLKNYDSRKYSYRYKNTSFFCQKIDEDKSFDVVENVNAQAPGGEGYICVFSFKMVDPFYVIKYGIFLKLSRYTGVVYIDKNTCKIKTFLTEF